MHSGKSSIFIVIFTLLVLVGQVMAAAMNTCQRGQNVDGNDIQTVLMAEHVNHSSVHSVDSSDLPSDSESCDCCELDCFCPMGSCVSVLFSSSEKQPSSAFSFKKFEQIPISTNRPTISSLFRPPIFA